MYPSRKDRLQIYNKRRMGRNMGTTQRSGHRDYHHKDQPHNLNLQTHVMSNIGCSSKEVPVTHSHLAILPEGTCSGREVVQQSR